MKKLLILYLFLTKKILFSQVSIGEIEPNHHSQLDVSASAKGVLIPRVTLNTLDNPSPFNVSSTPLPQSLLVFNTGIDPRLEPGYYYWQSDQWNKIVIEKDISSLIIEGQDIISSHLDITGGTKATLKEVNLAIKNNVISNIMLQEKAVTSDKINPGTINQVLTTNAAGTAVSWTTLAGDVTGTIGSTSVTKIQGKPLANTAPTTDQVLKWDGTTWTPATENNAEFGDVKQGFQINDHNGWVKLDGRNISTLTVTQRTQATALGFTTLLPNANDKVLKQKGGSTPNNIGGNNTVTISQANIPNYTLPTATTSTNGAHTHTYSRPYDCIDCNALKYPANNNDGGFQPQNTSSSGNHTHTVTVSSGGSGTPLNIENAYLTINVFVYLGQ